MESHWWEEVSQKTAGISDNRYDTDSQIYQVRYNMNVGARAEAGCKVPCRYAEAV